MITSDLYILYGFLAFISLLLVAVLGFLIRIAFAVGRLQGQYNGLSEQMREMNASLNARIDRLEEQMNNFREQLADFREQLADFREQLADFREQLAEIRGLMRGLHDRMDLLTRHRHDAAGRVVITPEEVAAD